MGGDQIARLAGWKEYEQILEYPVYVYPRRGERTEGFEGRITPLTDAPLQDLPATEIRERIGRGEDVAAMLDEGVAAYIRRKGLWSPATRRGPLGADRRPERRMRRSWSNAENSICLQRVGPALNDQLGAGPRHTHAGARQYVEIRGDSGVRGDPTTLRRPQASETIETTQTTRTKMEN